MSLARAVDLRPEDLAGRRWAGYIRESTRGQADRYGPDLQRAEQERFAERYGLAPAGLEYLDLVSGKDTLRRSDFARMVADAEAGRFDVLLCYDASRFARTSPTPGRIAIGWRRPGSSSCSAPTPSSAATSTRTSSKA